MLFHALGNHGFHGFQRNGQVTALHLLEDEFIPLAAMTEKHQDAVHPDQQQDARSHGGQDPEKFGLNIQMGADKADHVYLEEDLGNDAGTDCQQDNAGDRNQNPVQNTNFHVDSSDPQTIP